MSVLRVMLAVVALCALSPAQGRFAELGRRQLPLDRDRSEAVALGDVDGDGDLDALFGNTLGPDRLALNDGTGVFTFAPAGALPPVAGVGLTTDVALGDVDGDGDLDAVLGSGLSQTRLWLNDGKGRFTDATKTHLPIVVALVEAVALGDVDGDGDLDLVLACSTYVVGQNRLLKNDGKGRFTDVTAASMPRDHDLTTSVALGDVDGDGDLDLVFGVAGGPRWSSQNRLYLNDGKGRFVDRTAGSLPSRSDATYGVALGDVDGDGDLDLVVGNGDPFVKRGEQDRVLRNDGKGRFTDVTATALPARAETTGGLALGDVDGDGDLDLACAVYGAPDRLYLNDGRGRFADAPAGRLPAAPAWTVDVALGDVDGDRDLDLLAAVTLSANRLWCNDGRGAFHAGSASRLPLGVLQEPGQAVVAADVDGDGDQDLVLGKTGQDRVLLGDGLGSFRDATATHAPVERDDAAGLAAADVDGDGDVDLVVGNRDARDRLWRNDGSGRFTDAGAAALPDTAAPTSAVLLGDLDGDGDPDLVAARNGAPARLWRNDGKGRFLPDPAALPATKEPVAALAGADVDGDGDLDLVLGVRAGRRDRLWRNDGHGRFTDATVGALPAAAAGSEAVALGDVDGDGDPDLVAAAFGGPLRWFRNDGKGRFTEAKGTLPLLADQTTGVALVDVDGDGDQDLVLANHRPHNRVLRNDGSGRFTLAPGLLPASERRANGLAAADMDGDGDPDLIFANARWGDELQFGLQRQLEAPWLPRLGRRYALEIYAAPGAARRPLTALVLFGTARARPGLSFGPLGTLRIGLSGLVALPVFTVPAPAGRLSVRWTIPRDSKLVGRDVFWQAALFESLAPLRGRLTGLVADRVVR